MNWQKGDKVTVKVNRNTRLAGGEIIAVHDTGEKDEDDEPIMRYLVRYPASIGTESKMTSGWFDGHKLREWSYGKRD